MQYTKEQRQEISDDAKGKTIDKLEYCEEGKYWVLTFTDGFELSFRFMSEIIGMQSELIEGVT